MHARTRAALLSLVALCGCGGYTRFALRPPVVREEDRALARAPSRDEEQDIANTVDATLTRPISHAFLFEPAPEARDVNALDEVPDSSWITERRSGPDDVADGACAGQAAPAAPFTIRSTKSEGTTPGMVVEDATGRRFLFKVDALGPRQPEASTAADAIVSRIYWAAGYNVPCNRVLYVAPGDLVRNDESTERSRTGEERPLSGARLDEILSHATRSAAGEVRLLASAFIEGEGVGTWRAEGTRGDDPNDLVPHEDRRELRGERWLAAWVAHWDSRGPQSYDTFVQLSRSGGHVVHYFVDFSDSLGGMTRRTRWAEPRMGFATVSDAPTIAADMVGFGLVRRPWDEVRIDPRYPNLGYFDAAHFDPTGFSPQTPLVRWDRAQPADLAWMARRIARFDEAAVRAAVHTGRLTDAAEAERLVQILLERRRAILRTAFRHSSPLAEPTLDGQRLCVVDLGIATGVDPAARVAYHVHVAAGGRPPRDAHVERDGARLCVDVGEHFAPPAAADDDASRYAIVELARRDGAGETILRAHFYDLGRERGRVLAGVERP